MRENIFARDPALQHGSVPLPQQPVQKHGFASVAKCIVRTCVISIRSIWETQFGEGDFIKSRHGFQIQLSEATPIREMKNQTLLSGGTLEIVTRL